MEPQVSITSAPAPGPTPTTTSLPARRRERPLMDLGREHARVPWMEWFKRASDGMDLFMEQGVMPALPRAFRVTLRDGRPYAVFSVKTHIAERKCGASGDWREAVDGQRDVSDVITGYSLVGTAHDGKPVVLTVPPEEIASVECVLVQGHPGQREKETDADEIPFGFAAFTKEPRTPEMTEEEEPTLFSNSTNDTNGASAPRDERKQEQENL
jgi:hypothetical protein